jgi:hypothetical protein
MRLNKDNKKTILLFVLILVLLFVFIGYIMFKETLDFNIFNKKNNINDKKISPEINNNVNITACVELGCDNQTKYVGSKESDKYYVCDCRWAKLIKKQNLICFKSHQEALNINYTWVEC